MFVLAKTLVCLDSAESVLREAYFFGPSGKDGCGKDCSSGEDIYENLFEGGLSSLRRGFFICAVGAFLFRGGAADCHFRF